MATEFRPVTRFSEEIASKFCLDMPFCRFVYKKANDSCHIFCQWLCSIAVETVIAIWDPEKIVLVACGLLMHLLSLVTIIELNSKEGKRQKAVLLLMASIVRRSSSLTSEVAKSFIFEFPVFPKSAEYNLKQAEKKRKHSTRRSFIGFAMSFLEVGKPGLLRRILQQKEMHSGVLRGPGNDDDEIVVYVLFTLKDRVLIPESLAPPDLKRHPCPFRSDPKRFLGLIKELKVTEVAYHKAYMDEFPYNLEDRTSPAWFTAVSLVADLVSSVGIGLPFSFINSESQDLPSFDSSDVQSIMEPAAALFWSYVKVEIAYDLLNG
uniref:URB1 N-terminal domain-containing protein n=1 Tax=Vitis vinifera TaxID=29760 RepID=A5AUC3_VITVI|nr:hypothetical protein VITISV_011060 [Vitis vinifera]